MADVGKVNGVDIDDIGEINLMNVPAGGTETIEEESTGSLANGASYVPAVSGVFFYGCYWEGIGLALTHQYYSDAQTTWYFPGGGAQRRYGANAVGDGTNFRLLNDSGDSRPYVLFRQYYSLGTYQRLADGSLAAAASYSPGVDGFFGLSASSNQVYSELVVNGPWRHVVSGGTNDPILGIYLSMGASTRLRNTSGVERYYVVMHSRLI